MKGTENRIAVERKRCNDAVQTVNTYRRTVVGRFAAALAGVEAAQYFDLPEGEQQTPKVKFACRRGCICAMQGRKIFRPCSRCG